MEENQKNPPRIKITALGKSLGLFLAITYVLCILFDLLLPEFAMHEGWHVFLPGFKWLTFESFLLGLAESYAYGWYAALLWGVLYNYYTRVKHM